MCVAENVYKSLLQVEKKRFFSLRLKQLRTSYVMDDLAKAFQVCTPGNKNAVLYGANYSPIIIQGGPKSMPLTEL